MVLETVRQEINDVDAQLVALIEKRMSLVTQVAAYKQKTGKAIFDQAREEAVLDKVAGLVKQEEYKPYIVDTFADIMKHSRSYQSKVLNRSQD